jgi:hypothetical protein
MPDQLPDHRTVHYGGVTLCFAIGAVGITGPFPLRRRNLSTCGGRVLPCKSCSCTITYRVRSPLVSDRQPSALMSAAVHEAARDAPTPRRGCGAPGGVLRIPKPKASICGFPRGA